MNKTVRIIRSLIHVAIMFSFVAGTSVFAQDATEAEREAAIKYNEGLGLAQAGDYAGALPLFEEAISLDGENPSFYYMLGLCQQQTGKTDDAVTTLGISKTKAEASGNTEVADRATRSLGTVHLNLAKDAIDAAKDTDDETAAVHYQKSINELDKARELGNDSDNLYKMYILSYRKLNDFDKLNELKAELADNEDLLGSVNTSLQAMYLSLAKDAMDADENQSALGYLDQAAAVGDLPATGHLIYSIVYNKQGNFSEGAAHAEMGIEKVEGGPGRKASYYVQLGQARHGLKQWSAAIEAFGMVEGRMKRAADQWVERVKYDRDQGSR